MILDIIIIDNYIFYIYILNKILIVMRGFFGITRVFMTPVVKQGFRF